MMNIITCFLLITYLIFPVISVTIPAVDEKDWKTKSPDLAELKTSTDEVVWMRSPRVRMIE